MSSKAHQVLRQALQLPPKARADIAGTLLQSLDRDDDGEVEAAWAAEIERRLGEVESGKVKLVSWEQARRRIRGNLKRGRKKASASPVR